VTVEYSAVTGAFWLIKERGDMEEAEYKDNEKVLEKYTVKFNDKSEELECIITNSHLVIEAEETIRIPFSHIIDCEFDRPIISGIGHSSQPQKLPLGTATLRYFDELNNEKKLSLKMSAKRLPLFKESINKQITEQQKPMKTATKKTMATTFVGALELFFSLLFSIAAFLVFLIWGFSFYPEYQQPCSTSVTCILVVSLLVVTAISVFIGGVFVLGRKYWGWALACSIIASIPLGLLIPAALQIAFSKDEFESLQ